VQLVRPPDVTQLNSNELNLLYTSYYRIQITKKPQKCGIPTFDTDT